MLPYLDLGFLKISLYIPLFTIGFLLALIFVMKIGRKIGLSGKLTVIAGIYGILGLILGAKLVYMFTRLPDVFKDIHSFGLVLKNDTLGALDFLFGGLVYYGGLIGFCMGICLFSKRYGFNRLNILDLCTPFFPMAHAFGRVGCFCEGCCYGVEYHGFLSVTYPYNDSHPELSSVPRFPVQLLEAAMNTVCFVILFSILMKELKKKVGERRLRQGQLLGIYFAYYLVARFLLELLRGDAIRGAIGMFSTSQFISILMIPITVYLLQARQTKPIFYLSNADENPVSEDF